MRIYYTDGREAEIEYDGTIRTASTRELSDALFYADATLGEHQNVFDCEGCRECDGANRTYNEVQAERKRREQAGIAEIVDKGEPTFEERYAPYGEAWQIEQRERREEGY